MKPFTMPIIFWLMTIEDKKIREAAIRDARKHPLEPIYTEVDSLRLAMINGFSFTRSPKGFRFWGRVLSNELSFFY